MSKISSSVVALEAVKYWLVKAEPEIHLLNGKDVGSFPFSRLLSEKVAPFYGVRGGQAKNYLRDELKKGDLVLYYHSSCKVPGVYGIAKVAKEGYGDDDALDSSSPFFDKTGKHTKEKPYWYKVDLEAMNHESSGLKRPVSLEEMKLEKDTTLSGMKLFTQPRLSVQPVTIENYKRILEMSSTVTSTKTTTNTSSSAVTKKGTIKATTTIEKKSTKKLTGKRKRNEEKE
jgi:predicted RNA-binding protein with PUA-like domain